MARLAFLLVAAVSVLDAAWSSESQGTLEGRILRERSQSRNEVSQLSLIPEILHVGKLGSRG